jgi:hypothetical protein
MRFLIISLTKDSPVTLGNAFIPGIPSSSFLVGTVCLINEEVKVKSPPEGRKGLTVDRKEKSEPNPQAFRAHLQHSSKVSLSHARVLRDRVFGESVGRCGGWIGAVKIQDSRVQPAGPKDRD